MEYEDPKIPCNYRYSWKIILKKLNNIFFKKWSSLKPLLRSRTTVKNLPLKAFVELCIPHSNSRKTEKPPPTWIFEMCFI